MWYDCQNKKFTLRYLITVTLLKEKIDVILYYYFPGQSLPTLLNFFLASQLWGFRIVTKMLYLERVVYLKTMCFDRKIQNLRT